MSIQKIIKRIIKSVLLIFVIASGGILIINGYVKKTSEKWILSIDEAKELENTDCILVLGAAVKNNERPSAMLNDRLETGIELYNQNVSGKILMSGDHGRKDYDEVNVMKNFAVNSGVPSEDIFMDHAGFSTYESMYRAKEIFKADKIVIVSQKYHLYRAVYIARSLGIEAYGVPSDVREYRGQKYRDLREAVARVKDFFNVIIKPEPTYLGEAIPVSGNGDLTNDKQ